MSYYVRWFDPLSRADVGAARGKGANLGELTGAARRGAGPAIAVTSVTP